MFFKNSLKAKIISTIGILIIFLMLLISLLLLVKWRENISGTNFITAIRVSAHEEGVINQKVLEVIGQFNVSLRFFSLNKLKDVFEARMQLAVPNNQLLDKLIFSLKKIKGIKSVSRVSNV